MEGWERNFISGSVGGKWGQGSNVERMSRLSSSKCTAYFRRPLLSSPRGQTFEEDVDGNEVAVFSTDEVSGMDVVHADA